MRILLMTAAVASATTVVGAAECQGRIKLIEWSAEPISEATTMFVVRLETAFEKAPRMVDGYVSFKDKLGADMGAFALARDEPLPASAKFDATIKVGALVVPRALTIEKNDIEVQACVDGVIYEDDTKEEFN